MAIIVPPISRDGLTGYLNPTRPHDINHLTVDSLGTEEVLVTAHDDGDVVCYMMREILRSVQNVQDIAIDPNLPGQSTLRYTIEPRMFYSLNVGKSAWGIALHRQSRKMAISCNRLTITIVNFATTTADSEDQSQDQNEMDLDLEVIELRQHRYNIPNIAFLNSPRDMEGRWLCSTDLSGEVIIWDLLDPAAARYGICSSSDVGDFIGWGVLCLDEDWFIDIPPWKEGFSGLAFNPNGSLDGSFALPVIWQKLQEMEELPSLMLSGNNDISDKQANVDNPTPRIEFNRLSHRYALATSNSPSETDSSSSSSTSSLSSMDNMRFTEHLSQEQTTVGSPSIFSKSRLFI
jgi:hypothetical protein